MISANPEQRGVVSELLNLARTLGQTTEASLMGAIFAYFTIKAEGTSQAFNNKIFSASSASAAAITSGIHGTFTVAVIAIILAIVIGIIALNQSKQLKLK